LISNRLMGASDDRPHQVSGGQSGRSDVRIYASLCRVLEQAPIENKLRVFGLMAHYAADEISERRQQYIDDLWWVAEEVGLVRLLGVTDVQNALSDAFEGAPS
jgi:hypothetical protein